MATAKELKELTVQDLERRAGEIRHELFQDLIKMRTGTLDSPAARTGRRRDLARVLTVLTEKRKPAPGAAPAALASPDAAPPAASKTKKQKAPAKSSPAKASPGKAP